MFVSASCGSSRKSFVAEKKFSKSALQKDYTLFRNVLEESHPGLYWFTSKDSMDHYFDQGYIAGQRFNDRTGIQNPVELCGIKDEMRPYCCPVFKTLFSLS